MSTYKINVAKQRYNEAREKMLLSALDIVNKLKSGVSDEFRKKQSGFNFDKGFAVCILEKPQLSDSLLYFLFFYETSR